MTLPDKDTNATYGGALQDYTQVIDATTDRPAAGANPAYANVAMMTHTLTRFMARFTPAGTGTPVLAASGTQWDAVWATATATAPTPARTGVGVYTMTTPATVQDEIPVGAPGYNASGHSVNLRTAHASCESASTPYFINAVCSSPNVITIYIFSAAGSLVDPNGPTFAVWAA